MGNSVDPNLPSLLLIQPTYLPTVPCASYGKDLGLVSRLGQMALHGQLRTRRCPPVSEKCDKRTEVTEAAKTQVRPKRKTSLAASQATAKEPQINLAQYLNRLADRETCRCGRADASCNQAATETQRAGYLVWNISSATWKLACL